MEQKIAVIDMKAFYSFVECIDLGVNPFTTPLAVCDAERGDGTIVLSVSPFLKAMGVPSRCRKRELPKIDGMIFATPRMSLYLKKSAEVVSIILDFVGEDDIHVYSVDELFINLGPYLKMYDCTAYQLVRRIQKTIYDKTNLVTTAGIGPNMFVAKAALDLDGKKKPPYAVEWKQSDIKKKLWPVKPLSKMWGISRGYE
ncbi:MAG: damage repair protein, partial [Alphaproteobacteria bacterium]|nr:damage repair protein [Alphaproteobacteria bacterium]